MYPVDGDEAGRHHVQHVATGLQTKTRPEDCDEDPGHHADDHATHADQNALILNNLAILKITNRNRKPKIEKMPLYLIERRIQVD